MLKLETKGNGPMAGHLRNAFGIRCSDLDHREVVSTVYADGGDGAGGDDHYVALHNNATEFEFEGKWRIDLTKTREYCWRKVLAFFINGLFCSNYHCF